MSPQKQALFGQEINNPKAYFVKKFNFKGQYSSIHLNFKINRMSKPPIENTTGPLLHIVFFWLKEPENQEHRAQFETAIKKLIATNPQAIANHLGGPAASEKRAVVDNSFTYCYTMSFPSLEAQNEYQTDPTHELFIEEASPLWERVLVSDSLALS